MALRRFDKLIYKSGPKIIQFSILILFPLSKRKGKKRGLLRRYFKHSYRLTQVAQICDPRGSNQMENRGAEFPLATS